MAFRHAVEKGVEVPELAQAIVELFTGLWSSCIKASRTSLALRVFPDLTDRELEEMSLVDAYVDALDDFVDLECVDRVRGTGARALYVRTILLANTLVSSPEAKLFLGELGARKVFDSEYQFNQMLSRETLPHTHTMSFWSFSKTSIWAKLMVHGSSSPTPSAADSPRRRPRGSPGPA